MTIQESVREATERWCREDGVSPRDINGGNCEAFADEVASRVPGALALWDWESDEGDGREAREVYLHCFVRCAGLYFDSECHEGVADWIELPFYRRWYAKAQN